MFDRTSSKLWKPTSTKPCCKTNERRSVIRRAMTLTGSDDATADAGMNKHSAINDREVQWQQFHPECRDMPTYRVHGRSSESQTTGIDEVKSNKVKRCRKVNHQVRHNMKTVEARNMSKPQPGQWPKWLQKQGESMLKNKLNASAKIRRKNEKRLDHSGRPRPANWQENLTTFEVHRERMLNDLSVNKVTYQRRSHKVYWSSEVYPVTLTMNNQFESKSSAEQQT